MFKFAFDLDDLDNEFAELSVPAQEHKTPSDIQAFAEIQISQLLDRLPTRVSCSPLPVTLSSGLPFTLARRDLFDVRFQIISEQAHPVNTAALEFIGAPSDLVPGVYEGGLKTWECSLDLVNYLDGLRDVSADRNLHGKRILEIGCGTAVPSLYLLHRLFSSPIPTTGETQLHLQDYNDSVLEFVTFPNIFLTWYMSPLAAPFRESERNDVETQEPGHLDSSIPTEISITPVLKSAFLSSLCEHKISLRFFAGAWDSFDVSAAGGKYDIVLTSETIYRTDSLASLINLLRTACGCEVQSLKHLSSSPHSSNAGSYLCLVAAKVIYFGVGGGVSEFLDAVYDSRDRDCVKAELVWESKTGVGRRILRIHWNADDA